MSEHLLIVLSKRSNMSEAFVGGCRLTVAFVGGLGGCRLTVAFVGGLRGLPSD